MFFLDFDTKKQQIKGNLRVRSKTVAEPISERREKEMLNYKKQGKTSKIGFEALGTWNGIVLPDINDDAILPRCREMVLAMDDRWSVFKAESEIAKINAAAGNGMVAVSADTMKIIKRALDFSVLSHGVFDLTSRPLSALWGKSKDGALPMAAEIEQAKALVNYQDILIDEAHSRVGLRQIGQSIDLGGIAKGYAADEVERFLKENGIENGLIDLGGNIITFGSPEAGRKWTVGIQDPMAASGNYIGALETGDETIVTSGSYARYFIKDNQRFHHIIHPQTGAPVESDLMAVTVVGVGSMDMDALATTIFILGVEQSLPILKQYSAEAIFITKDFEVFVTKGLKSRFHPNQAIKRGEKLG